MKSFHLVARGARRRAQAPPAALHLARRDERVVRQRRRDDPLREGPGRDPLPEPVLLVLRQRGARPREGQGPRQVLRQAGRHRRPRAARAHRRRRQPHARTRCAARCRRRSSSRPRTSSAALLPLQGRRDPHRGQALRPLQALRRSSRQAKEMEGRHDFCEGCTVYCYMRSSLLWKYPVESVLLAGHYVRERVRQRIRATSRRHARRRSPWRARAAGCRWSRSRRPPRRPTRRPRPNSLTRRAPRSTSGASRRTTRSRRAPARSTRAPR